MTLCSSLSRESRHRSLLPFAPARPRCPSPHFPPRHWVVWFVLKMSDSEEKGPRSAVALKRKFLLSQQVPPFTTTNTFLCSRIKDNYLLGRRRPRDEAQLTLSQPFRTSLPPRATFPATRRRREDTDKFRPQAACAPRQGACAAKSRFCVCAAGVAGHLQDESLVKLQVP